ncbi:pyridoxamine 5'-phosphate oxidase family protein [Nocardia brasiliensis]|uniref:pyridoxamine 5'-phosphate oxidase family protein n=1 Tax=Nocardia brasiliensis TaxID=37326 RepID=UPI0024552C4A|nr:pyridoxamine 5'-phosphate oxidase family protein [Nocardia brasiliensis]
MAFDEREHFLADTRVGVLGITDTQTGRAPLLVPVWYLYDPRDGIVVQTGQDTFKARLLLAAGRFSLCVQDENQPYRYVSVEGPITAVKRPVAPAERETIARRYLSSEEADSYLRSTTEQLRNDITFHMRPQHWRTANFAAFATEFVEVNGSL